MTFRHLLLAGCLAGLLASPARGQSWRFDFGTGPVADGWMGVTPDMLYDAARGYGFDVMPNRATSLPGGDPITGDFITSDAPFKFSVRLPEGNFRVTVILGDPEGTSCTTVKAEERRLMLERVRTDLREIKRLDFGVNVRHNTLSQGNAIKFDVREWDPDTDLPVTNTWDDRLTLTFSDEHPCVCAVKIAPVDDAVTLFLIGDSTVTDQVTEPYGTWGQHLTRWFQLPVVVANHAESGQTAKGFRFQRRWDKVTDQIKPGDYVFIQFGHNDLNRNGHDAMWPVDDHAGNWINTYADALTDYKWLLATYALEVARMGGIPVIVTPMTKLNMQTGEANIEGMRDYPQGAREAAELAGCALIDLNRMSVELAAGLGAEAAPKAYVEGLHSTTYGGYLFARCIVEGIRSALPELAAHLTDDAGTFDTAHPSPMPADFLIPADPPVQVPAPPGMRQFFNIQR